MSKCPYVEMKQRQNHVQVICVDLSTNVHALSFSHDASSLPQVPPSSVHQRHAAYPPGSLTHLGTEEEIQVIKKEQQEQPCMNEGVGVVLHHVSSTRLLHGIIFMATII